MTFPFYAEVNDNSSILIEFTIFCVACFIAMIQGQGSYRLLQSLYLQDGMNLPTLEDICILQSNRKSLKVRPIPSKNCTPVLFVWFETESPCVFLTGLEFAM